MINKLAHWIGHLNGKQMTGLIVLGVIILTVSLFFVGSFLVPKHGHPTLIAR